MVLNKATKVSQEPSIPLIQILVMSKTPTGIMWVIWVMTIISYNNIGELKYVNRVQGFYKNNILG